MKLKRKNSFMKKYIRSAFAIICLIAYAYFFILCIWGKPVFDRTGHLDYIAIFHLLAIFNYLNFKTMVDIFKLEELRNKNESFFILHGFLVSIFPYPNYLLAGFMLAAAAIVSLGIKSRI
jgi:hypothetical protein